ncbi:MAG: M20/M25/M40 family metallo-hydrolase, partial [Bacilli bacterium]|nr:M20/M25/M40 family metallo-hydrolase [Bacilli bacterium]
MPNFKKLAKNYEKCALEALKNLASKNSVYDAKTVSDNAPYGLGVKSALDYVAKLGKDYGFKVDTCKGYATEITYGEGNGPLIGIYAHADVVPASGQWKNKPFEPTIYGEGKEAKIIARGVSDDKGPLIAALLACKLLKDNNLITNFRIALVAGGDEERGSSCLEHYFHVLKKPYCDYGFTPDADFPLIYAEKGIHHAKALYQGELGPIIAMDGGVVANAVCDHLLVTLPMDKKFIAAFKEEKIEGDIAEAGPAMLVTFKGKSAHG